MKLGLGGYVAANHGHWNLGRFLPVCVGPSGFFFVLSADQPNRLASPEHQLSCHGHSYQRIHRNRQFLRIRPSNWGDRELQPRDCQYIRHNNNDRSSQSWNAHWDILSYRDWDQRLISQDNGSFSDRTSAATYSVHLRRSG